MGQAAEHVEQVEDERYQQMMTSPGGVMLLVRLTADLSLRPAAELGRLCGLHLSPDPVQLLPAVPRLVTTFQWIEKKFGRSNATRAVAETCRQILQGARV